jgi:hypothetical protein
MGFILCNQSFWRQCAIVLTRIADHSEWTTMVRFVRQSLSTAALLFAIVAHAQTVKQLLPPWTAGYLYIHHISTGRGNAAYVVMPDGTTMLIDAGEADPQFIESVAPLKPFP